LQFLTHSNWCAWHLLTHPIQRHLKMLSCPFTQTQSMWQGLKVLLLSVSSSSEQVTSTRDHSFHLDSPGQSMWWKEQVFLMYCIRSVCTVSVKSLDTRTHSRVFLYLYYFLHCRIIVKTSKPWNNTWNHVVIEKVLNNSKYI
jgi:hypothetical protein